MTRSSSAGGGTTKCRPSKRGCVKRAPRRGKGAPALSRLVGWRLLVVVAWSAALAFFLFRSRRVTRMEVTAAAKLRGSGDLNEIDAPDAELGASGDLICGKFECFGKVQHVFMRKYTKLTAESLSVGGWISNTETGSVHGEYCGEKSAVTKFKKWLRTKGAPKARIDRAEFTEEHNVQSCPFQGSFEVRKVLFANGKQWA